MEKVDYISQKAIDLISTYGPKLIGAIIVLMIGLRIIRWFTKKITKVMLKREVDPSLQPFLSSLISTIFKVLLFISVASILGVEMTSFVAILGAAGLAIGMALSGTLQNFAGGVMILLFKPFKDGDVIEAQGYLGKVDEIQIFNTYLKTLDNKTIIIPNGPLSNGPMVNFSTEPMRKLIMTFGIGYGDNIQEAKEVILNLMKSNDKVLSAPEEPFVALSELADSSVNFTARAWVKGEDYFDVLFDMNEKIYDTFNQKGLNIPYPQMDIHLHKVD